MKRYLLALICLNCLVSLVYAQEETRIEEKDTLSSLESEVGLIPECCHYFYSVEGNTLSIYSQSGEKMPLTGCCGECVAS